MHLSSNDNVMSKNDGNRCVGCYAGSKQSCIAGAGGHQMSCSFIPLCSCVMCMITHVQNTTLHNKAPLISERRRGLEISTSTICGRRLSVTLPDSDWYISTHSCSPIDCRPTCKHTSKFSPA